MVYDTLYNGKAVGQVVKPNDTAINHYGYSFHHCFIILLIDKMIRKRGLYTM